MRPDSRESFADKVAAQIIEKLEAGTAPWQVPWTPGSQEGVLPYNATTGQRYKGINSIILMMQGHVDPRWLTYKQAEGVGVQVRRGEKGVTCQKWTFDAARAERDDSGNIVRDSKGEAIKTRYPLSSPRMTLFTVFNASQTEGMPPLEKNAQTDLTWSPREQAQALLNASGATIEHHDQGGAFYRPSTDSIHLPVKERFPTADGYYVTALHELGHWTGHESRLKRDLSNAFGSPEYAKEELRAEIASMMLGQALDIGHDPGQHVAYVDHWVAILKKDPQEIFRASADAEKIHRHLIELVPELAQQQEKNMTVPLSAEHRERVRPGVEERVGVEARFYLDVDRSEKAEAKALGARWDPKRVAWFVPPGVDPSPFARWFPKQATNALREVEIGQGSAKRTESEESSLKRAGERVFLAVPFGERVAAKAAGARWDPIGKSWYDGDGADSDSDQLARWRIVPGAPVQSPSMPPQQEFAQALAELGFNLNSGHPIMDGRKQRQPVEGDKKGERSGFYVGHLDGHPAGYGKNNRTQVEMRWKSLGYHLSDADRARLAAEAATKLADRAQELERAQMRAAERVKAQLCGLREIAEPTPYLVAKGLEASKGVYTDAEGKETIVPAYDIKARHWTSQYIQEDGRKRFAKESRKEGCFHVVGGFAALSAVPAIVIAEGYATAATASKALGHATVVAFDSGNLVAVAKALREQYPERAIIILGDDDRAQELKEGRNPGRQKATEAALAVNGKAIFPTFLPADQTSDPRAFSDYNDLARSLLGLDGVERQIRPVVEREIVAAREARDPRKLTLAKTPDGEILDTKVKARTKDLPQAPRRSVEAPRRGVRL